MKKIITIGFLMLFVTSYSQKDLLNFDKKFYECEDKWVVLPRKEKDSTFTYGFIYIDRTAGFTFHLESEFTIDLKGKFISSKKDDAGFMILRLANKSANFALIPDTKFSELGIKKEPDWLKIYKSNPGSIEDNVTRSKHYNQIDIPNIAITILLPAYKKEPHAKGLEFELSYAYNGINQFDKAIDVLKSAIEYNAKDGMLYKELGYSYMNVNKLDLAEAIFKQGIIKTDNKTLKDEMTYNMTYAYFQNKDKNKFDEWSKKALQLIDEKSTYYKNVQDMINQFK